MSEEKFEEWCILEIMGHQRYAGHVTNQSLGGASFVRIDVPEFGPLRPAFSKLFSAGSIYCITPVSEDVARQVAEGLQRSPINVYDFPEDVRRRLQTPAIPGPSEDDEDDYDEDN